MTTKTPKTPRVKRKEKKAAAMYEKNPVWKEEDAQGPIPGYKKGGTAKMKMGGAQPKAMYGTSMKSGMMKKGGVAKMKKYAMGGSALRPTTDKANRGMYKTGGMVNSNTIIEAAKKASTKGVIPGVNPKASKQTAPKGRVGGTSKAPKDASPTKLAKAKMGGMKGKSC